jgi:hypothetical protein
MNWWAKPVHILPWILSMAVWLFITYCSPPQFDPPIEPLPFDAAVKPFLPDITCDEMCAHLTELECREAKLNCVQTCKTMQYDADELECLATITACKQTYFCNQ